MYLLTPLMTLSGLNTLNNSRTQKADNLVYPSGSSSYSGRSQSYHFFHSLSCASMWLMSPLKRSPIWMSLYISFHPPSGNHLNGFGFFTGSRDVFPLRKNSSSTWFISFSPSYIMIVIWQANISLCISNIPRQV